MSNAEHQLEAFREACRVYLNAEGEQVERAFLFFIAATWAVQGITEADIEWAKAHLSTAGRNSAAPDG